MGSGQPHHQPMLSVQVLLWTTCLVSSCAGSSEAVRAEDTQFLLRETVSATARLTPGPAFARHRLPSLIQCPDHRPARPVDESRAYRASRPRHHAPPLICTLTVVMQGNLKQTVGVLNTQDFLPGAVDLRGGNLHLEWEALLLARLKEAVVTPALTQRRPVLTLASLLPVRAQQLISMRASPSYAMQQQATALIYMRMLEALHFRGA